MSGKEKLRISREEIASAFTTDIYSDRFPPIMNVQQAAELLQVPKHTLYEWNSRGRLNGCSQRLGKHLRFFRDRLVHKVMNEGVRTHCQ